VSRISSTQNQQRHANGFRKTLLTVFAIVSYAAEDVLEIGAASVPWIFFTEICGSSTLSFDPNDCGVM
jgi:hypothetical protein